MESAQQPCPFCNALMRVPMMRSKCPSCREWVAAWRDHPSLPRRLYRPEELAARKAERERNSAAARIGKELAVYGIPDHHWRDTISRQPAQSVYSLAARILMPLAAAAADDSPEKQLALDTVAGWLLDAEEPAQDVQRMARRCELLRYRRERLVIGVTVQTGAPGTVDEQCLARTGKRYSLTDALQAMPLPCAKAYCFCWFQTVLPRN